MSETQDDRINAFHDAHGQAWGVIELSGMAHGDIFAGALFNSERDARISMKGSYTEDELDEDHPDCLTVRVARWDREGAFWSYDY